MPRASRHKEGRCDSERVVGRVSCFKGDKQISDSNTDGLAWKLCQIFPRLQSCSASSVIVVDLGTGQLQKSQRLRLDYTPRCFRSNFWHSSGITSSQGLHKLHPGQVPGAKGVMWCWKGVRWMGSSGDVGTSEEVTTRRDCCSGYLGHSHRIFYPSVYTHLWGGVLPREAGERPQPTLLACMLSRCIPGHGAQ